jgi:hypothetical protein
MSRVEHFDSCKIRDLGTVTVMNTLLALLLPTFFMRTFRLNESIFFDFQPKWFYVIRSTVHFLISFQAELF